VNRDGGAGEARRFAEKSSFALIGFNQVRWQARGYRNNQSRKSASGTDVGVCCGRAQPGNQLKAVVNVTFPDRMFIRMGHQIDAAVPGQKHIHEGRQPFACFT
jgi:hypothetical protein